MLGSLASLSGTIKHLNGHCPLKRLHLWHQLVILAVSQSVKGGISMQYVCDAGQSTWFRIETLAEATLESRAMGHAVERHFRDAQVKAAKTFTPPPGAHLSEQNIGLKAHIERTMPVFLTLRDPDGTGLVTAMLPPKGATPDAFRPIVVGPKNGDPYKDHAAAIEALSRHYRIELDPGRCYPYKR
jgi:hypothetical protein